MAVPTLFMALLMGVDTIRVGTTQRTPVFDGRVTTAEWGTPSFVIQRPGGKVQVWISRVEGNVLIAAAMEDSTFYWGDDLVVSLDIGGNRTSAPDHDDFQWYLRRSLDSSVVFRGQDGRWQPPRGDPDWRIGKTHDGGGWEVRSESDSTGWSVELQLDEAFFLGAKAGLRPGIAFRAYDDSPQGWFTWPVVPEARQPSQVENHPNWWAVVELEG
jgi:hypothetical protein